MSSLEEIDVTLHPDGRVEVKVRGAQGKACLLATKGLEQHLGGRVISREETADDGARHHFFRREVDAEADPRTTAAENMRRLRAAGVTILAGSDAQSGVFPGPGLHRELALLRRALA